MEEFVEIANTEDFPRTTADVHPEEPSAPFWTARTGLTIALSLLVGITIGFGFTQLLIPRGLSPRQGGLSPRQQDLSPETGGLSPVPAPVPEASEEDAKGIPPDLLATSSDAACWEVVRNMHGEIGGVALAFHCGHATADGTDYRIVLEFARDGEDVLVKVAGNGLWAVKVDPSGKILRAYRWPRADRPLKSIIE